MDELVFRNPGRSADPAASSPPLAVDLDGTLIRTDLLVESIFALLQRNPFFLLAIPFWLLRGRAFLKRQIGLRVALDAALLPTHSEFLAYLREQRERGRRLVLASGSDERMVRAIGDHLGIFERVLASDGRVNLTGRRKRDRLVAEFGRGGYDYAGNSFVDLPVWASARRSLLVNPSRLLLRRAARTASIERVFPRPEGWLRPYLRALRLYQWLKNLLIFIPLLLAHRFFDLDLVGQTLLAFLAFSLGASAVYLINDLADLPADRRHPRKRKRPFAAGETSLLWGFSSVPLLLALSLGVGLFLPRTFLAMLLIYFLLNLAYSFALKRVALLDVILLAGLYTMRIMAGSAAVAIRPSSWLLAFSTFLFFSLALLKRYAELVIMAAECEKSGHAPETGECGKEVKIRGYQGVDKDILMALGSASGCVAVLVLAIYISSGAAAALYSGPRLIWFLCPLLLYWISYLWLVAHRGEMHDDPLVFTLRDPASRIVFLLAAVIFMLAR